MVERRDIDFDSADTRCAAWHYLPEATSSELPSVVLSPCVVMAHGFASTRELRLAAYAERFAAAGMHVLVFDYRSFGDSDGEPRQCVSIPGQLADYASAVACARALQGVDPERVALWGTSFSGGHVVVAGARDSRIRAVVSQCGMVDGRAAFLRGMGNLPPWHAARGVAEALADRLARRLGRPRRRLPVVGPPGTLRLLAAADAEAGVRAIAPDDFVNEACAEIILDLPSYRPINFASQLACPLLLQICEQDTTLPPATGRSLAARVVTSVQVEHYPIGHFDIYLGEPFERAVTDQLAFLERHLTPGR